MGQYKDRSGVVKINKNINYGTGFELLVVTHSWTKSIPVQLE